MEKYCHFCFNAHVWAKEPHPEEDYFDEGLHDGNDFSSCGIGCGGKSHQMFLNSGAGKPCNVETMEWGEDNMWHTVAIYYPKYCPECGRELNEYIIDERGTKYDRKRT